MDKLFTRKELLEMQRHFTEGIKNRDRDWAQLAVMLPMVNTALDAMNRADRLRTDIGTISGLLSAEYGDYFEDEVNPAISQSLNILDKLGEDGFMAPIEKATTQS